MSLVQAQQEPKAFFENSKKAFLFNKDFLHKTSILLKTSFSVLQEGILLDEIIKKEYRKNARKKIIEMPESRKIIESKNLCSLLKNNPSFLQSDLILAFMPLNDEINILPFIEYASECEKKIALPRITPGTNLMDFFTVTKQELTTLAEGSYGIKEPDKKSSKINFSSNEYSEKKIFIIVPGLAFTKSGKRLGRGKGFYDRFLSTLTTLNLNIYKAGVCFSCQIFDDEDFPFTENDIKMDSVFCSFF